MAAYTLGLSKPYPPEGTPKRTLVSPARGITTSRFTRDAPASTRSGPCAAAGHAQASNTSETPTHRRHVVIADLLRQVREGPRKNNVCKLRASRRPPGKAQRARI